MDRILRRPARLTFDALWKEGEKRQDNPDYQILLRQNSLVQEFVEVQGRYLSHYDGRMDRAFFLDLEQDADADIETIDAGVGFEDGLDPELDMDMDMDLDFDLLESEDQLKKESVPMLNLGMTVLPYQHGKFYPIMDILSDTRRRLPVLDFSQPLDNKNCIQPCAIGRYNEKRPGLYTQELFSNNNRDIHVGVDIGSPALTPVYAFASGRIVRVLNLQEPGNYGGALITLHQVKVNGRIRELYALYGHLKPESIKHWSEGDKFLEGKKLGALGAENENGGWPPHLHFQLSWEAPDAGVQDFPGVVSEEEREAALARYPDPRLVLGPIY